MKKSTRIFVAWSSGVAALGLAFAISAVPTAPVTAEAGGTVAGSTQESGAVPEGIKVHGHWVIEVRDPDGALTERREFDNDLHEAGKGLLSNLLLGYTSQGVWSINLEASSGTFATGEDFITEPTGSPPGNLSRAFGDGASQVVLSGSTTASADGTINRVITFQYHCASDSSPSDCRAGTGSPGISGQFTFAELASPVAVASGQTVQVTVTISFG